MKDIFQRIYLNTWGVVLMLILGLMIISGGEVKGQCPVPQTFTSSGNFVVPVGVTSITVEAWGGGGAGGGSRSSFSTNGGSGGQGGSYTPPTIVAVTPGLLTVNVGAGGTGVNNADGNDGGASSVGSGPPLVSAAGGNGGNRNGNGQTGGSGGNGNGPGGGTGGAGRNNNGSGNSGNILGGGGGGGRTSSLGTSTSAGGNGARGQVIISYNVPANTATLVGLRDRTTCINQALPLPAITFNTTGATGIQNNNVAGANGLPQGVRAVFAGNAAAGTITISGTPTSAALSPYNYSIPMTGGCTINQSTVTGTITVTPTVGTPTAITGTPPSCQLTNGTTTSTFATTVTNGTGFNWSISNPAAGSIGATTGIMTWANGFSGSVDIRVTANGCNEPSAQTSRPITITPTVGTPSAITGTPPTCQLANGTTTTTFATTATNSTGFNWSLSNAAAGTINPTSGIITWTNGFSGSVDIRVTSNGCNGPSAQTVRTVTITPTVGAPTAITGTPPTCQLTNGTTTTSFATTATNNTGFNWSLSNAAAGTINPITGIITWANGFSGAVDIRVTANGCNGPSAQTVRTITVNQNPIASAGSILAAICQGQTSAQMGGTVSGGAFGGTWSGGAGNWTNANNPTTATYTAGATETGSITLTLTTNGGSCGTTFITKTITVNPNPTALPGPALAAICQGDTSEAMGGSVGGGATGGIWNGGAGTWTLASDPALATYTAGASESGSITLTLSTNGGSCGTTSVTKNITVNPIPSLNSPVAEIRCNNILSTYTATSTVPSTSFSWTRVAEAGISNPTGNGATANATETLINTTPDPIDVVYAYTLTAAGCSQTQNVTVTVSSTTVIVTSPDPADYETCSGDGFADISVSATGTNLFYQWYSNTVADTTSGTAIPGEESASFNPSSIPVGIQYYYVKVISACGTLVSMPSGMYEVKPAVTVFTDNLEITDAQTICFGDVFTEIVVIADGAGAVTYQWYSSTSAAQNTNGTLIPGAIDANYTPPSPTLPITTAITRYYYVLASSACGTVRSVKTGAFRVNPTPQINDMINVVCSDGTFTSTPANNTNGVVPPSTTYSWSAPTLDAGLSGGAAGSGAINITGTIINSTKDPLTAIFTVTPLTGTCTGPDFTVTVTVNPKPVIPDQAETICSGATFTVSPVDGVPGTIVPAGTTYTWTRIDNTNVTGDTNVSAAQPNVSQTLTNKTNITQTVVYTVTPRSGAAGSCLGTPFTVTVNVDPKPVIPTQTISVCSESTFTVSPTNGSPTAATIVPASTTYTWTVVDNPNVTGEGDEATPQANISQTLTNLTGVNQTVVYTVIPTSGDAGNCLGSSFTINVIVNPTPVIPDQPATVCSESPFMVLPVNGAGTIVPTNTKYTWIVTPQPNVTGESDQATAQTNISQTLTNTTGVVQTVIYTVTPISGATGFCVGDDFTVTVTVNPKPTVVATPMTQTVCNNIASTTLITISNPNSVAGTVFTWTRTNNPNLSGTGSGTAASGNGSTILGSFTNNTTTTQSTTYTVTATSPAGCSSSTTAIVSVYPVQVAPVISAPQTVCLFTDPALLTGTAATGGSNTYTYQWQRRGTSTGWNVANNIAGATGLTYQPPNTNPFNPGNNAANYYYRLVATDQCGVVTSNIIFVEVINDLSGISFPAEIDNSTIPSAPICHGTSFSPKVETPLHFASSAVRYTWSADPNFITPATGGPIGTTSGRIFFFFRTSEAKLPALTATNNTNATVTTTITITPTVYEFDSGDELCSSTSATFNVTIYPTPVLTATPVASTICSGTATNIALSSNVTDNTTSYSWTAALISGTATGFSNQATYVSGPISQTLTNSGTGDAVVRYTITPRLNICSVTGVSKVVDITVSPRNRINLSSAAATTSQTVCSGAAITDITYNTTGATGTTVSGLPLGVTGVWSGNVVTISGTPNLPAGATFTYTVNLTGGCTTGQAALTGTITVSPIHTITAASDRTVCRLGQMVDITMTLGGGATGATVTGLPAGLTPSVSGTTLTISGTPSVSGPFTYTVTTTGNACASATTTGTITVTPTNTIDSGTNQTVCINTEITPINLATTGATGATFSGLPTGVTGSWLGNVVTISGTPTVSGPYNYTVTTTGGCGPANTTGIIVVTPNDTITLTTAPETTTQTQCLNKAITPITYATIGATGATVAGLPAGVTSNWTGNILTISGTPTVSGPFTYIITTTGGCPLSTPTGTITVTANDTATSTSEDQTVCVNTALSPAIIYTTTGADAIVPEGGSVDYNLPNGVTAVWAATNGDQGTITISGTPTEIGVFDYKIPLSGGCGSVIAEGTITVTNPNYPITDIDVMNPSSIPGISTFTVSSAGFIAGGIYTIEYSTAGVNQRPNQTITATATAGQLSFPTLSYNLEGTTQLTIISIQEALDPCPYFPPNDNTAPYGVNCSSEFLRAGGDATFYIPGNVSQVSIQVFGDGSGGNMASETMTVWASGVIFIVFDGTDVFATEVPPSEPVAIRKLQGIVSTSGPNGRIVFNYDCNTLPICGIELDNGSQYTDSDGFTVLRFKFTGPCTWQAPDGLDEFEVLVVGGGGGGGFGSAAGGGGGGAVVYQQYKEINMGGLPGLLGATFNISVGNRGSGASAGVQGENGDVSTFTGPSFDYLGGNSFADLSALGGGGGGSTNTSATIREGADGASGGGGAASGTVQSSGGTGTDGFNGGAGSTQTYGNSGAGGGGFSGLGLSGTYTAGNGILAGGTGGTGGLRTISGEDIYYGAGGGGTSSGATTNQSGVGGSIYTTNGVQYIAGGSAINNGIGQLATTYGSGGGAGGLGGGEGFPGVVYIRYPNFRILPVEYLYFNAKYNSFERAGDLTWATAKEWENDRFEIERSVNNVKEWEAIGEVAGAGYSDKEVKYDYSDIKLPIAGGNIFYRLKQYDFDGDFTYSDTKSIKVEALPGTTHWRVFPNPTTGTPFNIEILDPSAYQDEPITLRIISATGQFETIQVSEMKQMGAQVSDWFTSRASGIYTIEISWGNQREYHKVILRR